MMLYLPTAYLNEKFINSLSGEIKTIFEVGARELYDSINLSKHFKNARIYSYECNPKTIPICLENLQKEKNKNIKFHDCALSSVEGEMEFFNFTQNNEGASSLLKRYDHKQTQASLGKVKISTLNIELERYGIRSIDLLCMDVQGFELEVLKGVDSQKNKINNIILEAPKDKSVYDGAPSRKEIEDFMSSKNYEIKEIIQENLIEDNILFVLRK